MSDDKEQPVKNLGDMTEEEIRKDLIYDSFFTTDNGPICHCFLHKLTHFHAFMPEEACGKDVTDMVFDHPFDSEASTVCGCQECHFYKIKGNENGIEYEETDGKVMDKRVLKLPNFREY